ncbi:MAG: hypothetical protein PF440_07220 [Thiomicrorhabdus sp.]|jgi:hypothetical protein|nr:hypothetical protein [Thiomicrorhabdus sp.]
MINWIIYKLYRYKLKSAGDAGLVYLCTSNDNGVILKQAALDEYQARYSTEPKDHKFSQQNWRTT